MHVLYTLYIGTLRKNIHPKEAAGWLFDMRKTAGAGGTGTYMRSSQQFNPLSRYTLSTRGECVIYYKHYLLAYTTIIILYYTTIIILVYILSLIYIGPWLGPQSPRSRGSTSRGFSRQVSSSGQNYEGGPESFSVVEGTTLI